MKLNLKMMTANAQQDLIGELYDLYARQSNDHSLESFHESIINDEALGLHVYLKEDKKKVLSSFLVLQYFRLKLDIDNHPIYVIRALNCKYAQADKLVYRQALKYKLSNLKKRVCVLNHSMNSAAFARKEILFEGYPNPFEETPSYTHYLINCLANRFDYKKADGQNSLIRKPIWSIEEEASFKGNNLLSDLYKKMNPSGHSGLMSIQFINLAAILKPLGYRLGLYHVSRPIGEQAQAMMPRNSLVMEI